MQLNSLLLLSFAILCGASDIDGQIEALRKKQIDIDAEILNINNGNDPKKLDAINTKKAEQMKINEQIQGLVNQKAGAGGSTAGGGNATNPASPKTTDKKADDAGKQGDEGSKQGEEKGNDGNKSDAGKQGNNTADDGKGNKNDAAKPDSNKKSDDSKSAAGVDFDNLEIKGIPSRNPEKECISQEKFNAAVMAYSAAGMGDLKKSPSDHLYTTYKKYVCGLLPLKEQAQFMANVVWETGGLQFREELACAPAKEGDPPKQPADCSHYKGYHGRGFIQLTHDYNYKKASQELFGDDRLVQNPKLVSEQDALCWLTAIWYWNDRVVPLIKGKSAIEKGELGWSIKGINGMECGSGNGVPAKRLAIYAKIRTEWGISGTPNLTGCP